MKIYTKTGDAGQTGLLGGLRVAKDHQRVRAYGDVDELNAALGVVLASAPPAGDQALLLSIQGDLFAIGAILADPKGEMTAKSGKSRLPEARVGELEQAIDAREAQLAPLTAFILPGGPPAAAQLHLARTVCRRAEREIVTLARHEPVPEIIVVYLNRLSDLLFVLARHASHVAGATETAW